jgi:hypothetical protein
LKFGAKFRRLILFFRENLFAENVMGFLCSLELRVAKDVFLDFVVFLTERAGVVNDPSFAEFK